MMAGSRGFTLTSESIAEVVDFRQAMMRIRRDYKGKGDWFFTTWNPDMVTDTKLGKRMPFEDADRSVLVKDPNCWVLRPDDTWHGFNDLDDDYCMLDPIKVSIATPGINPDGSLQKIGVSAILVAEYLAHKGIIVENVTDFTVLFLFSIGTTNGKWKTLINALLRFKEDYGDNTSLRYILPKLVAAYPEMYGDVGLRDLSNETFGFIKELNLDLLHKEAFSVLPEAAMTPSEAYTLLVHNEMESVAVGGIIDRVVAIGVVPYPPGIPLFMPGEKVGKTGSPHQKYLETL
jgi:arginine/lysine/ornithine decarboxylase